MSGFITQAFSADSDLCRDIYNAISSTPELRPLFVSIAEFHLRRMGAITAAESSEEPAAKKRKLANGTQPAVYYHLPDAKSEKVLEIESVSFSIPQRKKLHFRVQLYSSSSGLGFGIQCVNPKTGDVEYELPGSELAQVLRLPVPEKATAQTNYIFTPRASSAYEPIVFTLPSNTPLKAGTYTLPANAATLDEALTHILKPHGIALTLPDAAEFTSATPEAHRKGDKAYHVKAFRGSKDGYLFFLGGGIFWGFKKPLLYLGFEDIESISYTSVLQRTFNLNVTYRKPVQAEEEGKMEGQGAAETVEEEIEFSMLDQADFAGINEYVQRHGLNDASLAAGRRAKTEGKRKANGEGVGNGNEEGEEDDGRTELEKAQQQLEDEDEEDDEDFDPDAGEDGEDGDGSGSGSEDDSDGDEYGDEDTEGKDLVDEELGSERHNQGYTDDEATDYGSEGGEGELEDEDVEADEEDDEQVAEPELVVVSQPAMVTKQEKPATKGRWAAANVRDPDPDDEDQL